MGRIQGAYEQKFRQLLAQLGARRIEQGIEWLNHKARAIGAEKQIPVERTFEGVYRHLRVQLDGHCARTHKSCGSSPQLPPKRFICDVGLGALARWLRASGYEARWTQDISDEDLIKEAQRSSAFLLTTDSGLMERRLLRD